MTLKQSQKDILTRDISRVAYQGWEEWKLCWLILLIYFKGEERQSKNLR